MTTRTFELFPITAIALACLAACSSASSGTDATGAGALSGGADCSPSRASGAVNPYEKALHDVIAYSEGTQGRSKDGYDVGFAYKTFSSCAQHPNMKTCSGGYCSTAAGRYQFLYKTWNGLATAISADDFQPNNQERGAEYLVTRVRKATVPTTRALTATEFSTVLTKLNREWASLPGSPYGQPTRTTSQLWTAYKQALANGASAPPSGGDEPTTNWCQTDADCDPNGNQGLSCQNGTCIALGNQGTGGSSSGGSSGGGTMWCQTDADCNPNGDQGLSCENGTCIALGNQGTGGSSSGGTMWCQTDADCDPYGDQGLACKNGTCISLGNQGGSKGTGGSSSGGTSGCITDNDCPANMFCLNDGTCADTLSL